MHEFLGGIAPEVRLLRGRCLSYGQGITFWPIREMVHEAAIGDHDRPRRRAERIAALLAGADESEAARIVDRVAETIGLAQGTADPEQTLLGGSPSLRDTCARSAR